MIKIVPVETLTEGIHNMEIYHDDTLTMIIRTDSKLCTTLQNAILHAYELGKRDMKASVSEPSIN